jgi:hypothetical protein
LKRLRTLKNLTSKDMNKRRVYRLNEWHPGAREIIESIEYFIDLGIRRGHLEEDLMEAIALLIRYRETGEGERVSEAVFEAIKHMEDAIATIVDDGYPEEWIYNKLKHKITKATD